MAAEYNPLKTQAQKLAYGQAAAAMPGEMADVETFYTPEMQQAVLAAMEEQARAGGAQSQAAISGSAIQSGFGVGGTSREASRRAKADSDMLNEILSSHVQNAQSIEQMRQQQAQDYASRKLTADENLESQKQQRRLTKLGYREDITNLRNDLYGGGGEAWAKMLSGAIGSLGSGAGSMMGGMGGGMGGGGSQAQPSDTRAAGTSAMYGTPISGYVRDQFTWKPPQR